MRAKPGIAEAIGRIFTTMLLLTGRADRAEAAILEAAEALDAGESSDEELLRGAVKVSIADERNLGELRAEQLERASRLLPPELKRVLRLSPDLRGCYVLRVLAGFPGEVCASLLHLETRQVEERSLTAMLELVRYFAPPHACHSRRMVSAC